MKCVVCSQSELCVFKILQYNRIREYTGETLVRIVANHAVTISATTHCVVRDQYEILHTKFLRMIINCSIKCFSKCHFNSQIFWFG